MKCICLLLLFCVLYVSALDNGLALTPQMGWNSWNHFGCDVNETVLRATADILVSTGLAALGYNYVNVDDCWAKGRDASGRVFEDPKTFPSGMAALSSYIHKKGLKFGIYSCAGTYTCAGRPGSLGYEKIDAQTYAEWGVDYLKYDNCYAPTNLLPQTRYATMRDALNATKRPILFSMCEWGVQSPWNWANAVGNSWRTTNDISDDWNSFIRVLDNNIGLSPYAGPGGWNDPDMLEVGNGGMTESEDRAHFFLWSLLKSPLLIGCDLTKMSSATVSTLGAVEVIAVNQDSLGAQGDLVYQLGPMQIWAGPLADGSRAVVVFNRHTPADPYNSNITVFFNTIGYLPSTTAVVRDLYRRENLGTFQGSITVSLPTHSAVMYKITAQKMQPEFFNWRPVSTVKINKS